MVIMEGKRLLDLAHVSGLGDAYASECVAVEWSTMTGVQESSRPMVWHQEKK